MNLFSHVPDQTSHRQATASLIVIWILLRRNAWAIPLPKDAHESSDGMKDIFHWNLTILQELYES